MNAIAASAEVDVEAAALFQSTLAACGVSASVWALVESCDGDVSLAAFAHCARAQGLEAAVFKLRDGDLPFLPIGALVELGDRSVAAVRAHGASFVLLEHANGKRTRVGAQSRVRPVTALEVHAPPKEGSRFFPRLVFRLRSEPHIRRAILLALALSLVAMALALAGPIITHAALSSALPDRATDTLTLLAVVLSLTGLQVTYVGWLRRRALRYLTMKLSEKAASDVFAHMLRLPFAALRKRDVGVVQQATSSAAAAAEALTSLGSQLLDAVLALAYLAYAFLLDPTSGLAAGGAGLLVVAFGLFFGHRRVAGRRELLARTRAEQQGLYETLANIETVKSESIEGRMLARWLDRLVREEEQALALRLQNASFATLLSTFERLVFAAVLLLMAHRSLSGSASIADLVVTVQVSASFIGAAQRLAALSPAFSDYRSNVERVDEALAEKTENTEGPSTAANTNGPAIALHDVWFRYDEGAPWIFAGLNLTVRPGETVILSWPSGAGKSTLLRLLSGLLPPTRGDALVYGIEASVGRRRVTYIPQHATLFPVSIIENLRILSNGAPRDRILAAAEATGLAAVVAEWGMGLETVVASGVANLSSGQRQLVAFTAAVASVTSIVLLDEVLAHVDLGLRAKLGATNLFAGRTVIAVVHDAAAREVAGARVVDLTPASR